MESRMKNVVTIATNNDYSSTCLKDVVHDVIGFGGIDGEDRLAYFFKKEKDAEDFRKLLEHNED